MMDLSPITNALKSVQITLPQAQPSVAEEMKPVPQAEVEHAVPPLPAKGGEPGLGEHLDLYDTEASQNPPVPKDAAKAAATDGGENPRVEIPAEYSAPTPSQSEAAKKSRAETAQNKKPSVKMELLGDKTGLPQPTTDPPPAELPFLTPLGGKVLGQAIDARI